MIRSQRILNSQAIERKGKYSGEIHSQCLRVGRINKQECIQTRYNVCQDRAIPTMFLQ